MERPRPVGRRPGLLRTGVDGDHQAWREIDGGTEVVPGGPIGSRRPHGSHGLIRVGRSALACDPGHTDRV